MKLAPADRWSLAVVGCACAVNEATNDSMFPVFPTIETLLAGVAGAVVGGVALSRPFEGAAAGAVALTGFLQWSKWRDRKRISNQQELQQMCTDRGGRWRASASGGYNCDYAGGATAPQVQARR